MKGALLTAVLSIAAILTGFALAVPVAGLLYKFGFPIIPYHAGQK